MKKTLLLCCMTCLMLVGCQKNDDGSKFKIGLSQIVDHPSLNTIRESMMSELEALGYGEDKVIVDYKNAQNEPSTLNSIMQTFTGTQDLIVAIATPTAMAAAPLAEKTPVIFSAVSDPVQAGLLVDPQKPDKNITGTSDEIQVDKILELALAINPEIKTFGYIYNSSEANSVSNLTKAQAFCDTKGLKLETTTVINLSEIQTATSVLAGKVDAIFAPNDNTIASGIDALNMIAQQANIPVYVGAESMVHDGGLATIGINYEDLGKETARMIVKVIEGTPISDIPVKVFNTNLSTYINKTTADKIGLTIPDSILNEKTTIIVE